MSNAAVSDELAASTLLQNSRTFAPSRPTRSNIRGTPYWEALPKFDFASGKSTHQDRLKTICELWEEYGVMIDPHTADGLKVGLEQRRPSLPLICLETALPAKFAETIQEALGREPERPAALEGIEKLPQHFDTLPPDVAQLKAFIAARVQS